MGFFTHQYLKPERYGRSSLWRLQEKQEKAAALKRLVELQKVFTESDPELWPPWDKLAPELLERIFKYCPLQEKLTVIPFVCKSWERVVASPYFWQEIDIEEWSCWQNSETVVDMLRMLLPRSSGILKALHVRVDYEVVLSFIADHARNLETLKISGIIRDRMVIHEAPKLANLSFLDLSGCLFIGSPALEAIGKHCKHLTGLRRNVRCTRLTINCFDDEAFVIASTMPELRHLEICYLRYTSMEPLLNILASCTKLEFLDVSGSGVVLRSQRVHRFSFSKLRDQHRGRNVVIRCIPLRL